MCVSSDDVATPNNKEVSTSEWPSPPQLLQARQTNASMIPLVLFDYRIIALIAEMSDQRAGMLG